jgi:hypothetical protein
MADLEEQPICIKFCFKQGGKSYENFIDLLKVAVGEQTAGRTQIRASLRN